MKKLLRTLLLIAFLIAAAFALAGQGHNSGTQQPVNFQCGQGQVWNGSSCYYP